MNSTNLRFALILFLFPCLLNAQVFDDFSDGDLTNNPVWLGNTDHFNVNSSFQLQLNASEAGKSYLSAPAQLLGENMEWSFWIRESFSPSNTNAARFYLMSDRQDLWDTDLCGYYLRFGENLSNDAVRLFRQNGNTHTLLCSATEAAIATRFDICVKVIRNADDEWVLYCSDKGSALLKEESRCKDTLSCPMNFLGLACQYTASNRSNFYFDDIYYGAIYMDTLSPAITHIAVSSRNEITIDFDEEVSVSALDRLNYTVDHQMGNPDTVYFSPNGFSQIHLLYNSRFPVNTFFTINIKNITDMAENRMKDTVFTFFLYESQLFDIVISEIMFKPTPVVGLPDAEYIELYNRRDFPIDLTAWQLQTGNSIRALGNTQIQANDYLIITAASNAYLFEDFGNVSTLSSMQLNNAGQTIRLTDDKENIVHFVSYSDLWHDNAIKKAGGWSLEMIDTDNPCEDENNWQSSQSNKGGTPGARNSIAQQNADVTPPALRFVASESEDEITVYFSEIMLPQKLNNKHAYRLSHGLNVEAIVSVGADFRSSRLKLSDKLNAETTYTLSLADTFVDCAGNAVASNATVDFSYGVPPKKEDVVINEILFNPKEGGVDFVEIYNRSNKVIDLRFLRLSTLKSSGEIDTGKIISALGEQLFPQQYKLLSTNPAIVQQHYTCPFEDAFIQMSAFPTYNNTSGTVILLHYDNVIDMFTYNEKMHYPLLKSVKGVSLERIHFDRRTTDEFNWHSAASTVGYATPGYINSSYSENLEPTSHFEVYPEIFSPDNDGYNDNINLSYTFPQAGVRASIAIYTAAGIKVRELINNQLLDTDGYFTWDGIIDGNIKASVGTYIFLIEYYTLNGEVKRIKKAFTLAIKY
ncbi:MAG: lamin tail domain-containing protein [Bacteroidales bacterium]|nr:lamin tail domain-containing protein [Bacteroidales bacterium]